MSLRARLLLIIVLVNLAVLGVVQVTTHILAGPAREAERQSYLRERLAFQGILQRQYEDIFATVYARKGPERDAETVKRILSVQDFQNAFRDMHVVHGKSVLGGVGLNPLGASQRDDTTFDLDAVQAGIGLALRNKRLVDVATGFCAPIVVNGEAVAGAWVESPGRTPPADVPLSAFVLPILISILVFALLANWVVTRTIGRHLDRLGEAAGRIGAGDYSARLDRQETSPEIDVLVAAFNTMASKVEGHTVELAEEVRRATEEAKSKERALVLSSRLASMGTLAAGIAHEINNPIGGMLNAVHRLSRRDDLTEQDRRYVGLIQDGLERVGRTARKMLDFTPRQLEPVHFSLAEALERARALVEHRLSMQGVDLVLDVPGDLPRLYGEPHEIQQVFLNLFLNSLDVLKAIDGGQIRVSVRATGGSVRIVVSDNGPGTDRETLNRALDPFFSGKEDPQASGLGLFICYSIIRNHSGEMAVESAPGHGFTVTITMPVRPPDA